MAGHDRGLARWCDQYNTVGSRFKHDAERSSPVERVSTRDLRFMSTITVRGAWHRGDLPLDDQTNDGFVPGLTDVQAVASSATY